MLHGKMGNLGAEKVKKHGFDWQQGYGGGCIGESPREKMGGMGGNGGKWGELGGNGEKCGKFWMLNRKLEDFGAEKVTVLIGNKARGGGVHW